MSREISAVTVAVGLLVAVVAAQKPYPIYPANHLGAERKSWR